MIEFKIEGFPDLRKDLNRLSFSGQLAVLNKAARAGAKVVKERISELAPRDTGTLAESIILTGARQGNDLNRVTILVGPSTMAFYGVFLEYGTAFISPEPFVDPAFKQTEGRVISAIAETWSAEVEKRSAK